MRRVTWLVSLLIWVLGTAAAPPPALKVLKAEAEAQFPDAIVFSVEAESDSDLQVVELEYGLEASACAATINRATPEDFEPARQVTASWTWDMRQTSSLPPGARVWWRWHLKDAAGQELTTETQQLTWLDSVYQWQSLQSANLYLHWYKGSQAFAQKLLDAAVTAQDRLAADIGVRVPGDIHLYIYASTQALQNAVLFEAEWTGGQAFAGQRIIILGIAEDELDWGEGAVAHELAHVVVGNVVSHCYSGVPTWVNEGLAVYAEGGATPDKQTLFEQAVAKDRLFSVRALGGSFPQDDARARLAYGQSYSLVDYLIRTYGKQKMLDLLAAYQAGYAADTALQQVYGFDADGLEVEWRASIGAQPMKTSKDGIEPTPASYPTLGPYAQPPVAATATPLPAGTPPEATAGGASGITALYASVCGVGALLACCLCLIFVLGVAGVAVYGVSRWSGGQHG